MIKKYNYKKHLILDSYKIDKVLFHLEKLDKDLLKFCIVQNSRSKVVGVLTDGDIRRILLKAKSLNEPISNYLKKKFYFCLANSSSDEQKKLLSKRDVNFLPILNKNKSLNSIIFRNKNKKIENEIFIFAGGRGKRMFPLTEDTPKPMLKIGGIPLLESVLNTLKNQGFYNFVISLNYLSKKIKDYLSTKKDQINLNYIVERNKLGTAGPLSLLKSKNRKPIICMNGDIYTNLKFESLIDYHLKSNNFCTICTRNYSFRVPYGVVSRGKEIINEKPEVSKKISAGIYVFNRDALKFLKKNKYIDMNDFVNMLYKKKKKIGFFHIYELVWDVGDIKTYEDVNMYLSKQ